MKNIFKSYQFSRELKRLAKENIAQGKHLCVMNDIVFKAMFGSDSEAQHLHSEAVFFK